MSDDNGNSTIELNRRRVLAGLGTIGVASAGAGAGTMALFSDQETSEDNTIVAGTLDLEVGSGSSAALNVSNVKPGQSGAQAVKLKNQGSIDSYLDFSVGAPTVSQADSGTGSREDGPNRNEYVITHGSGGQDNYVNMERGTGHTEPVVTNVERTGSPGDGQYRVTIDTPFSIKSNGGHINVIFDVDGDGFSDFEVVRTQDGWTHKIASDETGYRGVDEPSGRPPVAAFDGSSWDESSGTLTIALDRGEVSKDATFGGLIWPDGDDLRSRRPADGEPKDWFGNLTFPIVPGGGGWGPHFNSLGTNLVQLFNEPGNARDLADLLKLELYVSSDTTSSGGPLISDDPDNFSEKAIDGASGRPSQLAGHDYDTSEPLDSSSTKYLVASYELPYNTGNIVQGEELTIDVGVEAGQEPSQ